MDSKVPSNIYRLGFWEIQRCGKFHWYGFDAFLALRIGSQCIGFCCNMLGKSCCKLFHARELTHFPILAVDSIFSARCYDCRFSIKIL